MGMVLLADPTSFLFVDKHHPSCTCPTSYPVLARTPLSLSSLVINWALQSAAGLVALVLVELCLGQSVLVGLDLR